MRASADAFARFSPWIAVGAALLYFLHERLGQYIQRLVAATRPYNPDTDWNKHSPSDLVEHGVDLGASPRAIICWGRLAKVWALLVRRRYFIDDRLFRQLPAVYRVEDRAGRRPQLAGDLIDHDATGVLGFESSTDRRRHGDAEKSDREPGHQESEP